MSNPLPIESLEVIGYATKLTEHMVPTVVTPVFRIQEAPERVVLPPFRIYQGEVSGATICDRSELVELARREEVVLLETPVVAQAGHELWVDSDMTPRYDDRDDVEETLAQIASEALEIALSDLTAGDLDAADQQADRAMSADDRRSEPIAIKAAIRRAQGRDAGARVMAQLARRICVPRLFQRLVDDLCKRIPASSSSAETDLCPVKNVAKVHPSDVLPASTAAAA